MKRQQKILGTLALAAIGDSMGSVTENLSYSSVRRTYGQVRELMRPGKTAFALGNEPGQVTDDFSQIYLICKEVLAEGAITRQAVIRAILKWSDMPEYFNRFAGPTTRSAIEMYKNPDKLMRPAPGAVCVDYASKATNGAAMKIAPAGIFNQDNRDAAIADAITIARVTHENSLAISGACAVACAVATSYREGVTADELIEAGIYGAERGEQMGNTIREVAGASVVERIRLAIDIAQGSGSKEERLLRLYQIIGSGLHISEAVPTAFGIIKLNETDPLEAVIDAVNIGYDTDTIATIVGSMVGACAESTPQIQGMLDKIERSSGLDITGMARAIDQMLP